MQMGYNRINVEFETATEFEDFRRELRGLLCYLEAVGVDIEEKWSHIFNLYQTIRYE